MAPMSLYHQGINDVLIAHAEKYGIDGVAETAVDLCFEAEELAELIESLDALHERHMDSKQDRKRLGLTGVAPNYRKTPLERAEAMIDERR